MTKLTDVFTTLSLPPTATDLEVRLAASLARAQLDAMLATCPGCGARCEAREMTAVCDLPGCEGEPGEVCDACARRASPRVELKVVRDDMPYVADPEVPW